MELTGEQHKELVLALIKAFPSKQELAQMLKLGVEKDLPTISATENLQDDAFELVKTALAQGWVENLIEAALKDSPSSPELLAFKDKIQQKQIALEDETFDIFISYAHEDKARIELLVHVLEDKGWSVFWDQYIRTGQDWRNKISEALKYAGCMIVAWSHHSIKSNWVIDEATIGQKRGILIPILFDLIEPPLGFGSIQAASLSSLQSKHFEPLVHDIETLLLEREVEIPPCPYKGLAAFREKDKDYFFGRGRFTEKLFKAINDKPLVALVGNSGSGKSSVVFAGLVPQLSKEEWLIISFRPHGEPFKKLAGALIDYSEGKLSEREKIKEVKHYTKDFQDDGNKLRLVDVIENILGKHDKSLLLIIDQFEELFTLTNSKDLQHKFLGHIVEVIQKALPRFKLLLTMRSDFINHSLSHAEFGQELSEATLMLTAMSREELCEVIEKPAEKQGVKLEVGLTNAILDDVLTGTGERDVTGRLPLLEFALTSLWDRQKKRKLTHEGYQAIGEVAGALARYAEDVFNNYTPEERDRLKHVFTQLVRPGEGTEDTRRVGTKKQIKEQNWDLVTRLASERLVTTNLAEDTQEETVEVIHETLIRSWPQLREWVDTDRDFRIWQNRLRPTVEEWQKSSL